MGQLLLFIVVALVVASILFGVTVMLSGSDPGLTPVEPDGRSVALPSDRPLGEEDIIRTRFDTAMRGYRMNQVDAALQRAAYDIGYKGELIGVLEAEVAALREGRLADADVLRKAREAALAPPPASSSDAVPVPPPDDKVIELTPDVPAVEPAPAPEPSAPPAGPAAGSSAGPPPSAGRGFGGDAVHEPEIPAASDGGAPVERR
jgi:DivIVA domain-containing protein